MFGMVILGVENGKRLVNDEGNINAGDPLPGRALEPLNSVVVRIGFFTFSLAELPTGGRLPEKPLAGLVLGAQ